jgi:hypothetical protein
MRSVGADGNVCTYRITSPVWWEVVGQSGRGGVKGTSNTKMKMSKKFVLGGKKILLRSGPKDIL